ncbi:hypothetical protein GGQ20_001474 [Salinibacter ruber]|uniref:glycosyltransferase family 2 protein n=1 Tax=Salinibacter ruber TaxID=146919 RepID=UPI002169C1AC|nr:glycosyltransferase [Salinibacter ruber]MCS3700165.1 hypothetical protein [Salinibacter ruber]
MEDVTAVVINYNGGELVLEVIESILNQQDVSIHVIVVDDGSTDGSPEEIAKRFPEVEICREEENTKQINRLRNEGLSCAKTEKVFLTDNDVILDSSCIVRLLRVMRGKSNVGACIPRLMYLKKQSRTYQQGGHIHYVGTSVAPSRDTSVSGTPTSPKVAVGGGIALLDMKKISQVGGFDEKYKFGWGCDGELHQRLLLAGYECLSVPSAVGFHEFKPFDETRYYRARGQVYNRWRFILSHYSTRTLALVAPMLVVYESVQAFYYLLKGIPHLYVKGTLDAVRQLPDIMESRKEVQALRTVSDRRLLTAGPIYIRPSGGIKGALVSAAVTAISALFSGYWSLVRPLLRNGEDSLGKEKGNSRVPSGVRPSQVDEGNENSEGA